MGYLFNQVLKISMTNQLFIYSFRYDIHNDGLCKLESRQVFGEEPVNKFLFSDWEIDPSISPFIKSRFDIILTSADYADLLEKVKAENICAEGFQAEYLVMDGDSTEYRERLNRLKDIGYSIEGEPDYYHPTIIYSICHYEGVWYFGILNKHNPDWLKHKHKPNSFSSAINTDIAKVLVSTASKGDKTRRLLDACCGVGTAILEACIAGFTIEGCDINWKACKHTKANLAHYNYTAEVHHSDIKDLKGSFDAAIIDLPYNLYSFSNDDIILHIIGSVTKLTDRVIIVSTSDIKSLIEKAGFQVIDFCDVEKKGKKFTRKVWICERV